MPGVGSFNQFNRHIMVQPRFCWFACGLFVYVSVAVFVLCHWLTLFFCFFVLCSKKEELFIWNCTMFLKTKY